MRKGGNAPLNGNRCTVAVGSSGVDVLVFQLGSDDRVRSDADVVFYNQPASPEGAVQLTGPGTVTVLLDVVPRAVATIAIAVAVADGAATSSLSAGLDVTLMTDVDGFRWAPEGLSTERAAILAELYRRNGGWKLRNVSAGWEQGLPALFTHFGVAVDDGTGDDGAGDPVAPAGGAAAVTGTAAAPIGGAAAPVGSAAAPIGGAAAPTGGAGAPTGRAGAATGPAAAPAPLAKKSATQKRVAWAAAVLVAVLVVAALLVRKPDSSQNTARPAPAAAPITGSPVTTTAVTTASASPSAPSVPSSPSSTVRSPATTALAAAPLLAAPRPVSLVSTVSAAQAAVTALQKLRVAGRAPKTGYSRAQFGQTWTDDTIVDGGHNGCDTRNDILRRDLRQVAVRAGSQGCSVTSGTLTDPYTGKALAFSSRNAAAVQIDHVVALSNAWQTGAQALLPSQRQDLANDPINLQATAGAINQAKGDGDAATWLPPNKSYRCTYVARQVAVKAKYGLWVTVAERNTISTVLTACGATPATPLPPRAQAPSTSRAPAPPVVHATVPLTPTRTTTVSAPRTTVIAPPTTAVQQIPVQTTPAPVTTTESSTEAVETTVEATTPDDAGAYYKNCAAARAAGVAPLHRGDPGYRAGLDRDDDGIACEN